MWSTISKAFCICFVLAVTLGVRFSEDLLVWPVCLFSSGVWFSESFFLFLGSDMIVLQHLRYGLCDFLYIPCGQKGLS